MVISHKRNVGIGTTAPSGNLDVNGDVNIGTMHTDNLNSSSYPGHGTGSGKYPRNKLRLTQSGYTGRSAHQHDGQLVIYSAGKRSFTMGVMDDGMTTLQVKESNNGNQNAAEGGYRPLVLQPMGGMVGIGGGNGAQFHDAAKAVNTTPNFHLHVVGKVGSSNVELTSDERIKTEIESVPDQLALNQVRALDCKYYHYKDPETRKSQKTIGFIAQDVDKIIPNAISKITG